MIGRQFGSTDTIDQASKTLEGCEKYLGVLELHGFGAADKERLANARVPMLEVRRKRNASSTRLFPVPLSTMNAVSVPGFNTPVS